jgi:hypothetical protein
LEDIIQKLKDKKKALEAANDMLAFKAEAHEVQIAGLQGQCAYLNLHLKKFDPWPAKKETPLAIKDNESTLEEPKEDPKKQVVPKSNEEETPMEKSSEEHIGTRVKRHRTGNRKAYLVQFK